MQVTRKQPAPFGSSKLVVVVLVFIIQLLSFRTQSTNAAFTDLSCSVTVISGSSTADTYRYSNCNQASSTITVSSAAAVTFVSSTFMGIYHPNAMSGYSLIIQSTTITCGTGVNLIRFAGAVLSSTISISSSTTLTASSWAAAFDFQGGSGGGNAISALGMTILSSTLKPSMNLFSINGDITSSTISISGTGITTGYYGFAITGAATALTVLMSQLTMSCQYYNFYIQGAVTNSKFYLVTVTASSNIIEIFQSNTGNWSNSQITIQGGSLSASITQTYKAAIRISNMMSSCTILVTGATLIGDYGITVGAISGTTSISIIGSTISAAASKSGYALQIGSGTDYTKSGSVYISSSSLTGDSAAMYFGNTWTSMTVSVTSSTLVGATIAILMSGYMGGITFTAASSRISTTTTTTGQAIQTPAITTASTFSFSSTTFIANKLMWASQVITTPSVTFTFSSSTISMNSAFLQVSTTTVKNLQIVLSSSTVTIPSGTLFVGSSVNGVVLSNCGISITSCTVSAGTIFNPGAYSTTGTGIAIVITGTTGSRSSLTLSSGVFYDSSTSACTFTSLSLTMGNTAVTTNTGVLGGSSSGYLRLSSPSISFASTVSLTNYAVIFYGAITSGTMFFGQGTLSGSTSGGYHSFNGYVTSTTVTFSAITVTGPAGLSTWNGGCSSCTILISNVAATITGTSTASLIGFFSATYTGMQLTITSSSLSYTVSTASAFVSPIFTSSATLSGSTLRVVGNTISSTTSATAHTVAFLYSSGTTTISSSSVITLAKTTVSVAVSTVTPIYLAQATVTGSSISLLCHSFTSITVPMVRLNVFTASTLAVQSVAIWSSQVAGLAAITIAGSSSATATIAFADSFMHAPVVVSAASTSSVSLIKADCSWASHSYALNPASFVSGLQSAVASQLSCSSLVYTSGTCWTEDTLSRTSSSSSSQSEEQTQSETYSFQQSLSKSHSPATPSSSKESTETDSQSPDQSRSLSRSFPTPSQTQEQSRTSTFTDEITQSFSSSASRSGSWERSKSQSPTGEHASATLSTISRSPSPRTQSLSKTTSKSFSPVVPNRVGALVSFPSNSGVSIGSSYYAESGVQVLLLTAAGGFQDGVAVAATLELFPRLLDNRNVSWTGYMRSPQVTPTSLSLTTAVGSSSRISLSSPGTCTTSFLPCTAAVAITPVLSSASTVGQFNVQVGYQSGAYEVPAVSDIGFDTDRRPVSFGVLNTTQQAMVVPSSSGTMFMAAGLPPDTRHLVLQLFDMFGKIAAFAGPQDALSVITTFFASGNQTPAIQQSNAPVTTSDTYDILNPLGTAPVWFTDAGSGNLTVSLASGLPVSGGSQSTSLTINVSSTKCSVLLSGAIVSATPDQLTTTVTYGYPVTADSDDQLLCAWGTSPMTSTDIGVNIPANVAFASAPLRVSACSVSCNSLITANAAVSYSYLCRSVLQQGSCELLLSTAALAQVATPSPTMTAESSPSPNVVALFNTFSNSAPVMACSVITFLSSSNAQSPTLSVDAMNATNIAISTTTQLTAQLMSTGDVLTVGQVVVSPWMNGTTSSGWEVCAVNLSFANGTQVFDLPMNARSVTVTISSIAFSWKLRSGSSFSVTQGNFIGGASWAYTLPDTACLGNTTALRTVVLTTPSSSVQTFVNATGTLQTTTYVRYAIASSSGSTALFLSDLTSSDAIAATTSTNRTITFDIRSATLLARTDVTPVDTSVLVFRTDGYYDSGSFRRVALATPTITSMDGCPTTYYPSTAECPLNGTVALNIYGSGFNSTLYPNFIVGWQFPSLVQPIFCQQLTIISDVLARCTLYPGAGLYGVARVFTFTSDPTNPTVVSTSNATMSFTLFGSLDCPVGAANGLQCSGHGTCDFTSGLCTCYQTTSLGFWTSKDCSSCTQRYNNSVNCQALCPTNADGLICSGVGYCNQGQCWCGSSWSTSTCVLCPGQESQCSGHGTCDQSTGTCTCTLNDYQGYFNGSACDTCFNGFSGSSCTLACPQDPSGNICSNNGACYNGVCFCISTFCGVRCELDKATQDCLGCSNPSLYGPTCSSVCPGSSIPAAPCNGHGICDAGQQGTGACKCSKGYGSADCSVICPLTSTGVECSGNGYCSLSSGLCQCDRFYATPSCSVQCPVSGGVACSGHGACNEGSAGNGQCVCAVGYGGPACNITCLGDVPCNGHGICLTTGMCLCYTDSTNGFWGGSACTDCTNGYAGKLCNARCPQNASGTPCSGHGVCGADLTCTCYNSAGLGFWSGVACDDCSPGYFGSSCLNECPAGACSPCGGNGVCSQGVTGSGTCACIANSAFGQWGGSDCLSCAAGFYGTSCLSVCPMLNGVTCPNGACDGGPLGTGVCNCKLGFTRDPNGHCLLCSPGYYSTLCLACPSTSNGTCSGRGVCDDGIAGSGKCRCFGTSGGVACASNCPTAADGTLCGNGGTCSATVGTCVCSGNFTLDNAGLCNNCISGKYGTACNLFCQPCGYGTCNRNTGACDCTTGYWGATCATQCPGGANHSCSGNGVCDKMNGTCTCYSSLATGYYVGATCSDCDVRYASSTCKVPCPTFGGEVCSGRGTCYDGSCSNCNPKPSEYGLIGIVCGYACELRDDSCILSSCPTGYYGLLCNQQCPGANISNPATLNATTCGGAGLCDGNGLCHCNAGYYGTECESHCPAAVISGSARVCSARGSCRDGVCGCLAGYFGAACEVECPGGAATPCNARGVCSNATCTCYYGAVGTACETLCPGGLASPCSYHGTCQSTGACLCYSDAKNGYFRGLQCDECAEFYTGPTCTIQCLPSRGVIVGTSCACFSGFARADCSASCTPSALGVVCGGHGTCVEQETCRCDINYYGPRCGTYCTYDLCRSNLGLYRPQCNITTGACECRSSSIGQWAGALCDTCSTTTWGDECNFPCSCNNHGVCARTSGLCSCFGDPNNGFWSGTACGECRTGYFGVTCQSINVAITPASTPSSVARANVATPVNSWMLFDAESLLTLKGSTASTTVDVLGSTLSGSIDTLRTLTSPLGTVNALLLNSTHLLIVLIGGGKMVVLRNRTSLLSLPNLPLPQQRSMEELASGSTSTSSPAYVIANGTQLCALYWSFGVADYVACDGGAAAFDFSGAAAVRNVAFVAATPLSGDAFIVVGDNIDTSSQWLLVVFNFTTNVRTVFQASTVDSGEVLRCTTEANDVSIVCFIYNRVLATVFLKRLRLTAGGAVILSQPIVSASLSANATAMGVDPDFDTAFVAYNFQLQPSTVLTFRLSTLLPIGSFVLSGFFVVTSLSIDSPRRLLLGIMEDDYSTALLSLNLFGISAVVPNIVDLVGGALITVYGEGFDMSSANDTWCILSGVPIAATLVDTGTITCIAPRATNSLSACVSDTIDVRFGSRQTSQTTIGILRPVSAGIITAITDYGTEAYGSYDAPSNVTLSGFGFVNSQWAKCRLVNNSGHVVFIGDAFYINSTAAICQQPAGLPPTDTWSGLEYSHDGTYFGTSVAPFIIVGPTVNVVAVPTGSVIVSSSAAKMFDFSVYTTDVFYNRRLVLETRVDTVRCSSNVPELAIIGAAESVPFTPTSVRQVAIAEGISTFDSVYLQLPLTGFYTMYCFSFGDIKITTNFSFTVVPGVPAVIGMTPSSSWIVGVLSETTLLPKPTAWVQDVAGNHITNLSQIPRSMTLSTRRANAVGRSEVAFNTSVYVSLPDEAAFYTFDGVVVRSQFGVSTNLVLAVGYGVPTLVVPLQLEICREGVQYSEDNSFNCVVCPDAAYCDGTSLLETRPGYWRGTYTSLEFFDCAPREACPSPSYCGVGYTGIKCATCEQDYGQTSDGCTSCWPKWASWLANIAGFAYLCVLVFFASIGDMHITSYEDFSERFRLGQLNEERVNELVKKLLISQWQMLTAVPYGQLGLPTWLTIFYSAGDSSTTGDPQQVFVTCTLAPRPADLLYISIILVPGIIAVFAFVSAIVAYRRSATHVREEEEMAYRIDVASGKHKHDERMEEVFVEMEKRRRERKIKRLERAKNKAAKLHDDDPKYYSDFDNIEDSTMSGINMSSTFASPLESTPGVAEGGQQTTFVNRQAIALRRPNRNLPPRRNVQYAMVDQHEITVASSDASFTIFSPPAPLDATILEQNSNSPTVVPAQKSSDFHPVLPNGDDGGDGEDGTQAPPPKGLKAGFERFVNNMINDADKENEPMDEDEIRRSGYHKGLLLWDGDHHHRHVRSIQVLSDSMRFNSTQERKLERYRAELFSSDSPEALQLLEKFDLAKQGNSSRRRIETWKKWFNIFLVCVTFILTQCSQTLVKYSLAQLQGCDRVDLGTGSVMLSKADPQIDCSSWEYFKLKYLAIAVLVFSTVFIPLLSFGFIKLVQKTTCNVKLVSLTLAEMNVVISRVQLEMDALNPTMFGFSLLDFDALARIEEQQRTAIVRQFEHFTDLVERIPSIESRSISHFILIGGRCVLDKALKAKQADYIEGSEDLSRAAVEREWRNSLQGACREFFSVDPILLGTVSADDFLRASEMPPQEALPLEESPHLSPLSHDPFMRARVLDIVQEEEQRRKQLEDLWCKFDNIAVGGVMEARSLRAARSIFFFASGHFRTEVWWWESISMIKKSVLEVISAFIGDLSLSILLSVFVMLSYGVFNLWLKPYDDANLNSAENLTLTAVALSFGLMQLLFYPSVQESEPLKIFIFVMLIAINLLTMAALVYMMFTTSDSSVGRLKTIFKYIKRTYASIVHRRYVVKVGRARIKLEKYLRKYHRGGVLEDFYEEAWYVSRDAARTIAAGERRLSMAMNTPSSISANSPQQQEQQSAAANRKVSLQGVGGIRGAKTFDEIAVALAKHSSKAQRLNTDPSQLGNAARDPTSSWLSTEQLANDFEHAKWLVETSYRIMLLAPDGDGVAASLSKIISKLADRAKNCLLCHHTDVLPFAKPDAGLYGTDENPPPAQPLQVAIPHNDVVAPEQHVGDEGQAKSDPADARNVERTDHHHYDAPQAAAGSPVTVLPVLSGNQSSTAPSSVVSEVPVDREEDYAEFLEVWLKHSMQAEVDYMCAFVCLCRSTRLLRGQLNADELKLLNRVPALLDFGSKSPAAPTLLSAASPNAIPSGGNSPSNRDNALMPQETILAVPEAEPHVRPSLSPVPVSRPSSSHNNHHQSKSPRDLTRASVVTEDLEELTQNPQTKKRVSIAAAPVGRSRRDSRYITDFFPELSAEEQKKKSCEKK